MFAPIFLQGATGGISDDAFSGIPTSYQDIVGIDVKNNPKSIKLLPKAAKDSGSVVVDFILCSITVSSTGDIIAFGNAGNIYRYSSSSWVKIYTHANGLPIIGSSEFNGYIYWAQATKLHRLAIGSISGSISPTLDFGTFTIGNTSQHPMLEFNETLFIGDGSNVSKIDIANTFTSAYKTFETSDVIRDISYGGNSVKIFFNNGIGEGKVVYWDGINDESIQIQQFSNTQMVSQKDGVDYVLSDNILFAYPFQRQQLKRISSISSYPFAIDTFKNNLYIGTAGGVFAWGALNKDYPEVLTMDYKTSNNNTTDEIGHIFHGGGSLFFSWKNGSSYGIDKVQTTYDTGSITSRYYYGNYVFLQKSTTEMFLSFKALAANESIKIYTKVNGTGSFTLQTTINNTYTGLFAKIPFHKDFNILEVKIELTGTTTTPELYELIIGYNEQGK